MPSKKTRLFQLDEDGAKRTGNAEFLEWAEERKSTLGPDKFREVQDEINAVRVQKIELNRQQTTQLQTQQSESGIEYRFELVCNNVSSPHRYDLSAQQLGDYELRCIVCQENAILLSQKKMERFTYERSTIWVEIWRQSFRARQPNFSMSDMMWAWLFGRLSARR